MEKTLDLRIQKTYMALYEAFLEMLSEQNFEDITVNELCDRAMVRRATFYKHFADKYDFFGFFIRRTHDIFSEEFPKQESSTSLTDYYAYLFERFLLFLKKHRTIINHVIESRMFPTVIEILADEMQQDVVINIKKLQEQEEITSIAPEIPAAFYTGGILQTLYNWILSPNPLPEDELIKGIHQLLYSFSIGSKTLL